MRSMGSLGLMGAVALISALAFPGFPVAAAEGEKLVPIVNMKCPVMGTAMEKEVDESMTRMHKGQRVGFCCDKCLKDWDAMNDADREVAFKAAMGENLVEIANSKCPVMGTAMESTAPEKMTRMYQGARIGFCCEQCLKEWDAMTDAEREPIAKAALTAGKQ